MLLIPRYPTGSGQNSLNVKEYEAAKSALAYIARFWHTGKTVSSEMDGRSLEDFRRAIDHLEVTYIIRLFATFEGLLKQYLATHHKEVTLPRPPNKTEVGWYVNRISQLQPEHISLNIRRGVEAVRDCRNDLMHTGRAIGPIVPIEEALLSLGKYLDKLPHPR